MAGVEPEFTASELFRLLLEAVRRTSEERWMSFATVGLAAAACSRGAVRPA